MAQKTAKIRALNDELRQYLLGGGAVITPGIAALGQEAVEQIVRTIAVYDDFCHANDPHEEHDFGSFDTEGHTIMFKIDYYDPTLSMHSADPADHCRTLPSMPNHRSGLPLGPSVTYCADRSWAHHEH